MNEADALVDPTATHHEAREPAPGVSSSAPRIGLVDGMLNKSGMWGQGILDAAEQALEAAFPAAEFSREMLDPLNPESPDRWATTMARRYEALVIAAGD